LALRASKSARVTYSVPYSLIPTPAVQSRPRFAAASGPRHPGEASADRLALLWREGPRTMSTSARRWLALITLLAAGISPLHAQEGFPTDRPKPFRPLRPETQEDRDRRESLKQYALGLICQREDRLL